MKKIVLVIGLVLSFFVISAQNNQFDAEGKRHGVWIKKFKNGNIRYQGKFNHGKEIGIFKYYSLESPTNPIIIKKFNPNDDISTVRFFTPTGKLLSKGKMQGKKRIEKWLYYHKDGKTIMQEEYYINGKLDGKFITYYTNRKPTIETNYKNGLLEGAYKRYTFKGFMYQNLHYSKGMLNGSVAYFDRLTGKIIKEGFYKNDLKTGIWKFYFEGELVETKDLTPKHLKITN